MQQPAKTCCVYEGILPAIKSDQSLGLDGGGLDKLAPRRRVLDLLVLGRVPRYPDALRPHVGERRMLDLKGLADESGRLPRLRADACVPRWRRLAAGVVQLKPMTEVEATSILPFLNGKTARS